MMERPPINRLPIGFLGFVDIKSMGQNPRTLSEQVSSTLDVTSFYMAEQRRRFQGNFANPTGPNVYWLAPEVPRNKCWLVESIWVFAAADLVAGQTVQCAPVIGRIQAVGSIGEADTMWAGPPGPTYTAGAGAILNAYNFDRPFVMLPTWRFGINVSAHTGTSPTLQIGAAFLEVDA